jgi:hypothetical protein
MPEPEYELDEQSQLKIAEQDAAFKKAEEESH